MNRAEDEFPRGRGETEVPEVGAGGAEVTQGMDARFVARDEELTTRGATMWRRPAEHRCRVGDAARNQFVVRGMSVGIGQLRADNDFKDGAFPKPAQGLIELPSGVPT